MKHMKVHRPLPRHWSYQAIIHNEDLDLNTCVFKFGVCALSIDKNLHSVTFWVMIGLFQNDTKSNKTSWVLTVIRHHSKLG